MYRSKPYKYSLHSDIGWHVDPGVFLSLEEPYKSIIDQVTDLLEDERNLEEYRRVTRDSSRYASRAELRELGEGIITTDEYDEDAYLKTIQWVTGKVEGSCFYLVKHFLDPDTDEYLCSIRNFIAGGQVFKNESYRDLYSDELVETIKRTEGSNAELFMLHEFLTLKESLRSS